MADSTSCLLDQHDPCFDSGITHQPGDWRTDQPGVYQRLQRCRKCPAVRKQFRSDDEAEWYSEGWFVPPG